MSGQQPDLSKSKLEESINERYDRTMFEAIASDFYRGSDYINYGYWDNDIDNGKDAGDRLMEKLLENIPNKYGRILDVACGKGETSKYLSHHYEAANITGINISDKQLEICRSNVPDATFLKMDAVSMDFADDSFDAVICVEAAFHFNTRKRFLGEAFRVLQPGGHIVLSDILRAQNVINYHQRTVPENHLDNASKYQEMLENVGFELVSIRDTTKQCWQSHFKEAVRFGHERLLQNKISLEELKSRLEIYYQRLEYTNNYLLIAARKPLPAID